MDDTNQIGHSRKKCRPALSGQFAGPHSSAWSSGFTLIEIVFVVAILLILAALVVPEYPKFLAKASQAKCMANMRALHLGLSHYLDDHANIWPQGPAPAAGAAWADFWIRTLESVDVPATTWECSAIRRMMGNPSRDEVTSDSIHYSPTMFDNLPGTARRWPTQPWLVERADAHGNGALLCFTDGSIKPFNKVLAELGYR
jgi:prepilin-type N-terminal cleavage/methylation domain-containing protein